jgi:hypothetical protein
MTLDREAVDAALRYVIECLDYDLHKSIEVSEDDDEDTYDYWVDEFIYQYNNKEEK